MESFVLLPVSEEEVMALVQQLTPQGKRQLLQKLLADMNTLGRLVDYDEQRMRAIAAERHLAWESLSDDERMRLLDETLHEDQHG